MGHRTELGKLKQDREEFFDSFVRDSVRGEDIGRAIETRTNCSRLVGEKIQDMIDRGFIMIDIHGDKVGQINEPGQGMVNFGKDDEKQEKA